MLQSPECLLGISVPLEPAFLEKHGERGGGGVVVPNEVIVISGKPEEGANRTHRVQHQPVQDCSNFLFIHSDTSFGDDMLLLCN
jgi:hypothetical protein